MSMSNEMLLERQALEKQAYWDAYYKNLARFAPQPSKHVTARKKAAIARQRKRWAKKQSIKRYKY